MQGAIAYGHLVLCIKGLDRVFQIKTTLSFASNMQDSRGSALLRSLSKVPTSYGLDHIKHEYVLNSGFSNKGLFPLMVKINFIILTDIGSNTRLRLDSCMERHRLCIHHSQYRHIVPSELQYSWDRHRLPSCSLDLKAV